MQTVRINKPENKNKFISEWMNIFICFLIVGIIVGSFITKLEGLLIIPFLFTKLKKTNTINF